MAAPEIDIGQLSEEQQLALEQYTSVTAQDVPAAVALLQRSQWNVQVSRQKMGLVYAKQCAAYADSG
jgi:FAS-associated factor 2